MFTYSVVLANHKIVFNIAIYSKLNAFLNMFSLAYSIAAVCENLNAIFYFAYHGVQLLDFDSLEVYFYLPWKKDCKLS